VVDHPGLVLARVCPVKAGLGRDAAKGRVESSSPARLSASAIRKYANRVAAGKPRIPVRNAADRCWSRHETMVWFSYTLTV
jgi:hypothetical protein